MSQAGLIDIEASHPQIPTQFDTDSGSAVPISNTLEILGDTVANGTNAEPLATTGSGNTVTIEMQVGAAVTGAPGNTTAAGIVQFDDTEFSVDANGYVTLIGGGVAIDTLTGDNAVAVASDGAGNINFTGSVVTNATNLKPLYFEGVAGTFTQDLQIQISAAVTGAPPDTNDAGISSFNDAQFTVDANGYVALVGGADLPSIQTITSDDPTAVGPDGSGNIDLTGEAVANATNAKPVFVDAGANALNVEVQVGAAVTGAPGDKNDAGLSSYNDVFHTVDADGYVDLTTNWEATSMHGWNGSIIETTDVTVTSDGATITLSVEQNGGGDLTVVFSDPDLYYTWDTTPADTVTLTAGTDTVPVQNFVYFLNSTKTLTVSTAGWPATEHAPIATVVCQSAASLQTDGAYKVHVWTDHVTATNDSGHIGHLNFWIRQQPATWISGVSQTYTITPNGGAADNVIFTTTAGVVLQLHEQTFPAFSGTPDLYVVNDSVTPYTKVTDLNALLTDATGASMVGKYFSLVIWGCVSEDASDCKLFVNLPNGSYNSQSALLDDIDAYSVYTIPSIFRGTGFLISEWKLRHQAAASGTWTSIDEISLLGLFPSLAAGGTPGSIAFTTDSGVATPASNNLNIVGSTVANATNAQPLFTTGATDTVTAEIQVAAAVTGAPGDKNDAGLSSFDDTVFTADADGYVSLATTGVAKTITGDSGGALSPTANNWNILGGTGVSTAGAGSTLTINATGGGFTWNDVTGTSDDFEASNGYITNNAGLVTVTLPATCAVGDSFRIAGLGAGGWKVAQNASQVIHFGNMDTTTGVGGSLASTNRYDCVEFLCVVTNNEYLVVSSVGNITVT